ncbi:MAG: type I-F CRISPR-associated protein Csy1 [Trichlorobacter sp.]|nr:type I-F CRISPR-associated protein Csy1 [Trichlorobacter sp.]
MNQITKEQVQKAVYAFLYEELEKELAAEIAKLKKPTDEAVEERRIKLREKYNYTGFIDSFIASVIFFYEQELSLATHISKGINPLVRSDNVIFKKQANAFGHQLIRNPCLDANSNNTGAHARHLTNIVDLLNIEIAGSRLYRAFIEQPRNLDDFFSSSTKDFKNVIDFIHLNLSAELDRPQIDERNKQLLFPLQGEQYCCLVPLFPSSLSWYVYQDVTSSRYSKDSKESRAARRANKIAKPYKDYKDVAYLKLGGTKPQNVSSLTSKQGGRNYLLPSLPPQFKQNQSFKIQPYADSLFSKGLEYRCRDTFAALVRLIKTNYNNVNIRNARKDILDSLLYKVLAIASSIQEEYPAGWSKNYSLHISEKLWLDPQRAEQDEQFAEQRQKQEWQQDISNRFANWLNAQLKQQFKKIKHEFADAEHLEWQQEMQEMINETQRQGMEIFQ